MLGTNVHSLQFGAKTHYTPLEASIRWSGLIEKESVILAQLACIPWPDAQACASFEHLHFNLARIKDGLINQELPYGRDGVTCDETSRPDISDPTLTIRHTAIRKWLERYYPDEMPAFIFGTECFLPRTISLRAHRVLRHELDALKIELARSNDLNNTLQEQNALLQKQRLDSKEVNTRSLKANLSIVHVLKCVLLGQHGAKVPPVPFKSQKAVIEYLNYHFPGRMGLSPRNLESVFARAQRVFKGV
jgi:hypothetical protein